MADRRVLVQAPAAASRGYGRARQPPVPVVRKRRVDNAVADLPFAGAVGARIPFAGLRGLESARSRMLGFRNLQSRRRVQRAADRRFPRRSGTTGVGRQRRTSDLGRYGKLSIPAKSRRLPLHRNFSQTGHSHRPCRATTCCLRKRTPSVGRLSTVNRRAPDPLFCHLESRYAPSARQTHPAATDAGRSTRMVASPA